MRFEEIINNKISTLPISRGEICPFIIDENIPFENLFLHINLWNVQNFYQQLIKNVEAIKCNSLFFIKL